MLKVSFFVGACKQRELLLCYMYIIQYVVSCSGQSDIHHTLHIRFCLVDSCATYAFYLQHCMKCSTLVMIQSKNYSYD